MSGLPAIVRWRRCHYGLKKIINRKIQLITSWNALTLGEMGVLSFVGYKIKKKKILIECSIITRMWKHACIHNSWKCQKWTKRCLQFFSYPPKEVIFVYDKPCEPTEHSEKSDTAIPSWRSRQSGELISWQSLHEDLMSQENEYNGHSFTTISWVRNTNIIAIPLRRSHQSGERI